MDNIIVNNLGGFPPIFYSETTKEKREFKKIDVKKTEISINKLNILNIKDILAIKK